MGCLFTDWMTDWLLVLCLVYKSHVMSLDEWSRHGLLFHQFYSQQTSWHDKPILCASSVVALRRCSGTPGWGPRCCLMALRALHNAKYDSLDLLARDRYVTQCARFVCHMKYTNVKHITFCITALLVWSNLLLSLTDSHAQFQRHLKTCVQTGISLLTFLDFVICCCSYNC